MRFYRVAIVDEEGNSGGFMWTTSMAEARQIKRENDKNNRLFSENEVLRRAEIEVVEIEPTKQGILAALRKYADHSDNG